MTDSEAVDADRLVDRWTRREDLLDAEMAAFPSRLDTPIVLILDGGPITALARRFSGT